MNTRIAVIQFPGSNTERETFMALRRVGLQGEEFLWNDSAEKLRQYDGYIIVGGFSYEDRSRAGIIAALDPLMTVLIEQSDAGKPLLGICNGAQILVESGLVPGVTDRHCLVALAENRRVQNGQVLGVGYYNDWVRLKRGLSCRENAFNRHMNDDTILRVPIAHAEGRFLLSPELFQYLSEHGQVALQYCDRHATVHQEFPYNPNGSVAAIAALSNVNGNVMAMMPHPERTPAGDTIFASMRDYIQQGDYPSAATFEWPHLVAPPQSYTPTDHALSFIVRLMITDNHALSVETALCARDIDVRIRRTVYWEVVAEPHTDIAALRQTVECSGELWNANKEQLVNLASSADDTGKTLLVLPHDDVIGQQKQQLLAHHYRIDGIEKIKHGILWQIEAPDAQSYEAVLQNHILFNPISHDCYQY